MLKFYKFLNLFIVITLAIIKIIPRINKRSSIPVNIFLSLTNEQVFKNKNTLAFEKFLAEDRFNFDIENKLTIIEIRKFAPFKKQSTNTNLKFTRDVHFYIILRCIRIREILQFYFELNKCIDVHDLENTDMNLKTFKKNIFDPAIWRLLNYQSFENIKLITTQTHASNLPDIFRIQNSRVQKIMMWYSTNSVPIRKYGDSYSEQYLSEKVVKYIDQHYVWNSNQSKELAKQGISNIKLVGSILFYPRKKSTSQQKWVTYFDVTPITNANTIYTEEASILNLLKIIDTIENFNSSSKIKFKLRVKPKRGYTNIHAKKYIELLESMKLNGKIEITNWNVDLYEVISESMLILAPPFSSPIEIGEEMKVPSAYFFAGGVEWDLGKTNKVAPVLRDEKDLLSLLVIISKND